MSRVATETPLPIPVMDYEGSDYRTAFWEGKGRDYEDKIERAALQRWLPPSGGRIAELGAGFGRLADLYLGYEQIILFDYSRTLLADAVKRWGDDPRFIFVAGNLYDLPLATGVLDTVVMARVMHHLADVPTALKEIQRSLHGASTAILEYANKRNLKAIGRWLLKKQDWSPFASEPVEFVRLNFDFHPQWMQSQFEEAGLVEIDRFGLSHFRLPLFKRLFTPANLVQTEKYFFGPAGHYPLSPSVLVKARLRQDRRRTQLSTNPAHVESLFRCPHCTTEGMMRTTPHEVRCQGCGEKYQKKDGIWDFKKAQPV